MRVDRPDDDLPDEIPAAPAWLAVARGGAFFLGAFTLLLLLGEIRGLRADSHMWWIDLRPCPAPVARGFLGLTGALLVLFAIYPSMPRFVRRLATLCVMIFFTVSLWNAFGYYEQLRTGTLQTAIPISFSLHVAACLAVVLSGLISDRGSSAHPGRDLFLGLLTFALCAVGFPLAQIFCQGTVESLRPSDAAVVFACDLPRGEEAAPALEARVETACRLYAEKRVRMLILTGGPGPDGLHQSEIMRRGAIQRGVPEADLIPETSGTNVEGAVKGTIDQLRRNDAAAALVVSDYYLLPRITLWYHLLGTDVETVPATGFAEPRGWRRQREEITREIGALWLVYLRPLVL